MSSMQHQAACRTCSLNPLCLPVSLSFSEMDRLDAIVQRGRPLAKGEFLYRQGQPLEYVYAVRNGTLKTFTLTRHGEEQITGFHIPSEVVGLASFGLEQYQTSAMALETTHVCAIPMDQLENLSAQLPELRRQLMRMMSREIRDDQQMMLLLSKKNAEERLASFLVSLAQRFKRRGYSDRQFRLTMPRSDLANFLGLALETVSRTFTRFQRQNLIQVAGTGRDIQISEYDALCELAALTRTERQDLGIISATNIH